MFRVILAVFISISIGTLVGFRFSGTSISGAIVNNLGSGGGGQAGGNPPGCTDGVDCVCDTVASKLPQGTSILLCEDFDAPVLYSSLAQQHWVDSGWCGSNERGYCQYWHLTYGTATGGAMWDQGQPNTNPRVGSVCNIEAGSACNGVKEWCSVRQGNEVDGGGVDCWEANQLNPHIDIVKYDEDFYDEISTLTPPKRPGSTADGVIAGNHAAARRISTTGTNALGGGSGSSWASSTNLGIAILMAYSSNVEQTNILNYPWKHNEWGNGQHGYFTFSSMRLGGNGKGPSDFPLQQFAVTPSGTDSQCINDSLTAGPEDPNGPIGVKECTSQRYRWYADPNRYSRSTDWSDLNEWRCIRARITGLGTTNTCYTMWFNNGFTEKVVIDFCGMDSSFWNSPVPTYLYWNSYANANIGQSGVTATTYRYEDSIVITDGEPPSCADIGF